MAHPIPGLEPIFGEGIEIEAPTPEIARTETTLDDTGNRHYGTSWHDDIWALGGDDWIFGGFGDDRIFLGDGNDHGYGQWGNDEIHGGAGDDELRGESGEDRLHGDDGNDALFGGEDNDHLEGGRGRDLLIGGEGDDVMHGETMEGLPTLEPVAGQTHGDFLYGEAGDDTMFGGLGDDYMDGGSEDDAMWGGAGNDEMRGGTGRDAMFGGAGFDIIYGDGREEPQSALDEQALLDQPLTRDIWTWTNFPEDTDNFGEPGQDDEPAEGILTNPDPFNTEYRWGTGADDDIIFGNHGGGEFFGGQGDDIIVAGNYVNLYYENLTEPDGRTPYWSLSEDNPNVTGLNFVDPSHHSSVYGIRGVEWEMTDPTGAADRIFGGTGNDRLFANGSGGVDGVHDHMEGGGGDDFLYGSWDGDVLYGDDAGVPQIWLYEIGHAAFDYSTITGGDDHIFAMSGDDRLIGGLGNDYLHGGDGADIIIGGLSSTADGITLRYLEYGLPVPHDGDDTLIGGRGSDTLLGGSGDDYLRGASEFHGETYTDEDLLEGGLGDDILDMRGGNHTTAWGGNSAEGTAGGRAGGQDTFILDGDQFAHGGATPIFDEIFEFDIVGSRAGTGRGGSEADTLDLTDLVDDWTSAMLNGAKLHATTIDRETIDLELEDGLGVRHEVNTLLRDTQHIDADLHYYEGTSEFNQLFVQYSLDGSSLLYARLTDLDFMG